MYPLDDAALTVERSQQNFPPLPEPKAPVAFAVPNETIHSCQFYNRTRVDITPTHVRHRTNVNSEWQRHRRQGQLIAVSSLSSQAVGDFTVTASLEQRAGRAVRRVTAPDGKADAFFFPPHAAWLRARVVCFDLYLAFASLSRIVFFHLLHPVSQNQSFCDRSRD